MADSFWDKPPSEDDSFWDAPPSDPDVPAPRLAKGKYKPQLGQTPTGDLPPKSSLGSLLRGSAQGASLGYIDEGAGLLSAAKAELKGAFGNGPMPTDSSNYRAGRDEYRKEDALAEQSNPALYGGADMAGMLATAPLAGSAKTLKGAVWAGTKLGALLGLGNSEADLTEGDVAGASRDTAIGAGTGLVLAPVGYGIAKGAQALGTKIGDTTRNLGWLFGGKGAPNVGRALDTLGVEAGSAPNESVGTLLANRVVPAEDFPPSVLNKASSSAPEAVAKIGTNPRVQVAEASGKQLAKSGLAHIEEMPWANDAQTLRSLVDLRRGIIPKESRSMGLVGDAIQQVLRAGRGVVGTSENLARAASDPAAKAELLQIIAAGRKPNLSADAVKALSARALTLLGVDALQ